MVSLLKKTLGTTAGVLLLAAGAFGVVAGCSNTDVVATADPFATVEGFCEAFATAKCSAAVVTNCYHSQSTTVDLDTTKCVAAASSLERCNPGNLPYHPENAAAALTTITDIFADGQIDGPTAEINELQELNDSLASVFYVGLSDNSDCSAANQCDIGAGSTCIFHAGKGSCAVPVETANGDSCSSLSAQCEAGYYCDNGFHCVSVNGIQVACDTNDQCITGKCGTNGRCQQLLGNNARCEFDTECLGGFCLKQAGDNTTGQCAGFDNFTTFTQSCEALQ